MGQASLRAFHFVADAARPVMGLMMRGRNASRLQPTPGARTVRIDDGFVSGQALAGSGVLVWEGEVLEPRASCTIH